jgi:hypothetical protein
MSDGFDSSGALEVAEWSGYLGGPSPRTPEGIGYGSSVEEVRAAYPNAVEVTRQGLYLLDGTVFFRVETGVVDGIGVTASNDIPWEYCG